MGVMCAGGDWRHGGGRDHLTRECRGPRVSVSALRTPAPNRQVNQGNEDKEREKETRKSLCWKKFRGGQNSMAMDNTTKITHFS